MWYFSWALGVALAATLAILNAMWFELDADRDALAKPAATSGDRQR
jgi:cyd operon protein YbgT